VQRSHEYDLLKVNFWKIAANCLLQSVGVLLLPFNII
jgi:hypothetical protein